MKDSSIRSRTNGGFHHHDRNNLSSNSTYLAAVPIYNRAY